MSRFDNVSIIKKANVYFDGKCVSHTVLFADGARKTVGVILPGKLTFNTSTPELMEINSGVCRVKFAGSPDWHTFKTGGQFRVPGNSNFEIETLETLDYVCHFG
ncbi:MAG TPA: pyrimidine/purine nucleoside phosphorylase [Gammaproteobacteria bacterium]|nr:pyrimidine/purine nucleoside phosphorylase [Gammaproteobacteria bacterium]